MDYKKQKEAKLVFWQKHVRTWEASGLSQAEYCRNHGLREKQLNYYKLRDSRFPINDATLKDNAAAPLDKLFIPVIRSERAAAKVQVVLKNGVTVEFNDDIDPAWVGKFLGCVKL